MHDILEGTMYYQNYIQLNILPYVHTTLLTDHAMFVISGRTI